MLHLEWLCRNVVATFDVGGPLSLRTLSQRSVDCEYNPRRFTAAVFRLRVPRVSVLVFASGKCVVAGGRGVRDSRKGARRIARLISRSLGTPCDVHNFTVQNMVFTVDVPFRLRIDAFYERLRRERPFHRCFYDPICFPGIRCATRPGKSPSLLIFASGKIICAGVKRAEDVLDIGNAFIPLLEEYRSPVT